MSSTSITPSISNADKALKLASSYVEPQPEMSKSSLKSGSIHWSFYATLGLGSLGAITSVASTILFNFGLTLLGAGVSLFGCIFSIYFIHKLGEYRTLQTYSDLLVTRVHQLVNHINHLQFAAKTVHLTSSNLSSFTEVQSQLHEQNTKSMKVHTEEISRLTQEIYKQEAHLKKWQEVCEQMKHSRQEIADQNEHLKEENEMVKEEQKRLISQMEALKITQTKLQSEVGALEKVNQKLETNNHQLSGHERQLSSQVEALSQIHLLAADKQNRLREDIHKLAESSQIFENSTSLLEKQGPEVKAVVEDLSQKVERLKPLLDLLAQLKASASPSALDLSSPRSTHSQPGMPLSVR